MTILISDVQLQVPDRSLSALALRENAEIAKGQLAQRSYSKFGLPLSAFRVWDAMASLLPGTSATDDLALVTGTPGTNAPRVSTGDVKASSVTRKAAIELIVPPDYEAGESIELRLVCGMQTTVADTSATIDVEVHKSAGDGSVGADICATAAQSMNSLTFSNKDFVITPSGIAGGDRLIAIVTIAVVDSATGTAVIASIADAALRVDVR